MATETSTLSQRSNLSILFINKWLATNSVLIVSFTGLLLRLKCPFKVKCVAQINGLDLDEVETVTSVRASKRFILVYVISGKQYRYDWFVIL